ncbi:MAG: hypothetical protein J0L92_06465 [Deltaproteobacteria bacterium]|nr:hypothetical protein [Deltaproteobacteria bacterium]
MRSPSTQSFAEIGRLGLVAIGVLLAHGCGSTGASRARGHGDPHTNVGAALALVWTIEGHAASCSVTRPTFFSDARRSLLARFRPELALGYTLDADDPNAPRTLAFARCVVGDEHASREHTLVRFSRPLDPRDRVSIAEALPFDARWDDEPCDTLTCGWRAIRIVQPDTVLIEGLPRPGIDTSQPDVRRLLASQLASRPESFEITVMRAESTRVVVLSSLERIPRGIARVRRDIATREGAEQLDEGEAQALQRTHDHLAPTVGPDYLGFRLRGDAFEQYLELPWSSVEASVADVDLERRMRVRRAARDRILPIAQIDLDEPEAVRRQAGARALAVRVSRDTERRLAWSTERAHLLERLFELTEDVRALLEAVSLLRELGANEAAHALAARARELVPDDLAVREAFVETADATTLAATLSSLRPDLDAAARSALSDAVLTGRENGASFATVEASFDVERLPAPRAGARVSAIEIPRDALAETALLLLRAEVANHPVVRFAMRVGGPLRADAARAVPQLGVRWTSDHQMRFTTVSAPVPLSRLRWMSQSIAAQLPDHGEIQLDAFADLDDQRLALSLRLRVEPARVHVIAASVALAPAVWTSLVRDVFRPALAIPGTTFPPPTLRLTLAEPLRARVASRVVGDRVGALRGGLCTMEGQVLACTGHERAADALLDVLAIIADETIDR